MLFSTVVPPAGRNIQVMDVATGVVTTLFDASATSYDSAPAWSPDGRQIAFESDADGDREIYVMNADGSNVRQITHNTLWDEGPAWSPDGTKFAFSSGADDLHLDVWTMNVDGSNPRQLTTYPGRDESPGLGRQSAPGGGRRERRPVALAPFGGPSASFGAFVPGVARDYSATASGVVTSTAGNATLSVADTSGIAPGHLVNGTFSLPQALQVRAGNGAYAPVPRRSARLRRRRSPTTRSRSGSSSRSARPTRCAPATTRRR